jgi:hypothetical protein
VAPPPTLADPGGVAYDEFGYSVAVSGAVAVIGAPGTNEGASVAYVYARSGGTWSLQATLSDPAGTANDNFGYAVAVSGTTAVIGTLKANSPNGAAYVYARIGGTWRRQVTLLDPGHHALDNFGAYVAISGGTAVIGAPGTSSNRGAAYVYARSGQTWRRQTRLAGPRAAPNDFFGFSVAVSGARVLVGGLHNFLASRGGCGRAYEYTPSGSTWHLKATVIAPRCVIGDGFADSLALSGTTAVIGAPYANHFAGAAYYITLP